MYFDTFRSGHDALGVTAASPTWYFAEGFTGGNATTAFETFLLLVNPGTRRRPHRGLPARLGR